MTQNPSGHEADPAADFSNATLHSGALPRLQDLELEPLAPAYKWIGLGLNLLWCLPLLLLCVFLQYRFWPDMDALNPALPWLSLALPSLLAVMPPWSFLADRRKAFALRERDLSLRSGLLRRTLNTQPFLRIQHVELKRGPLERRFGLATLKLFNASGGTGDELVLPGLPHKRAAAIRQFIVDHRDVSEEG